MTVHLEPFLRPPAARFFQPRRVAYVRRPPRDDCSICVDLRLSESEMSVSRSVLRPQQNRAIMLLKQICSHLEALAGSLIFLRLKNTE